jgi:Ca-activated chloride channel family protein
MADAGEIVTQGTLKSSTGQLLPLTRTEVVASIAGPLAEVVVRQRFENPGKEPIEAVYLFPLPAEASVWRMEFRIADRVVRGVVKEKEEARRIYEQARSEGRAATLLEEDRPSLFTLSVANVAPGAVIDVELAYMEMVPYDDGHFRWVFPMVAPETYREGPPPAASEALPPPRLPSGERGPDVSIEVHVKAQKSIEQLRCASHPTQAMHPGDGSIKLRLPPDTPLPNRDFVLSWQAGAVGVRPLIRFERRPEEAGTMLLLLTPSLPRQAEERMGGQNEMASVRCGNCGGVVTNLADIVTIPGLGPVLPCRFCGAVLSPGTALQTRASRPRDVLVLVDRSASMRGSLPAARRAVNALFANLAEGDCVQLVAFDHDRAHFAGSAASPLVTLAKENARALDQFLAGLTPRGGTDLEGALDCALTLPTREGRTRAVVLITDAGVGNEGRLLRRIPELLAGARLFVLGVGPSVDRRLIARIAQAGGGAHDVMLPEEDVEITVTRFARRVREGGPILTNLMVTLEGAALEDVHPTPLPDLFGGQPARLLARFTGMGPAKLVINGLTAEGRPYRQEALLDLPAESTETPGLHRLWAKHHVEALAARLEREPGQATALRAEATAVALRASLVGPFTSLVAEDSQVSVAPVKVRKLRLTVVGGPDRGRAALLDRERFTIGRTTGADLQLRDGNVSRLHSEIRLVEGAFVIRDIDSANGTLVDGVKVREKRIGAGTRLTLAGTTLEVSALPESPHAYFEVVPQRRVEVALPEAPPASELADDEDLRTASAAAVAAGPPWMGGPTSAAPVAVAGPRGAGGGGLIARAKAIFAPASAAAAPPPPLGMAPPGMAPPPLGAPAAGGFGAPPPPPGMAPPAMAPPPSFGAPPPAPGGFGPPPPASYAAPRPSMARPAMPAPPPMMKRKAPVAAPAAPPPAPARTSAKPGGLCPSCGWPSTPTTRACEMCGILYDAEPAPVACPRCSTAIPKGNTFCGTCGAMVVAPPPPLAERAREPAPPPQPPPRVSVPQSPLSAEGSEPYPEREILWLKDRLRGELDLVFLVDATGSMGAYIAEVKNRLLELVDALRASPLCKSLRLGLVTYRDHPPQELSYVTEVSPLSTDVEKVRKDVLRMFASGGGDGPEAVTDGLFDVVRLDWRASAAKAVVWFGDAPPHGVEPSGDGFPGGCPCGQHWYAQAESCREMGIAVYSIGCLPGLRKFHGAEEVFRTVARAARGMFLLLREAQLLVPMIAGAAESELDRQRVDEHVAEVVKEHEPALARTDEAERIRWVTAALRARGVRARGMAEPEGRRAGVMRFRDLEAADVEGALWRLRGLGRIAV